MDREPYVWGRNYRALIERHARACPLSTHQLAEQCDFRNIVSFQRHRAFWQRGYAHRQALIPRAYLDAIGIDWCALIRAVERDALEFDAALEAMSAPDSIIVNRRPSLGVTVRESLPRGLTNEERDRHIQRLVDTKAFAHCNALVLDWPGMKQVCFHPQQEPTTHLWRPRMLLIRDGVDFGEPPAPRQIYS